MDGRHGLRKQLEELRDSTVAKDSLVKYLGHHANGTEWFQLTVALRNAISPTLATFLCSASW
jgi:hypothetical protein